MNHSFYDIAQAAEQFAIFISLTSTMTQYYASIDFIKRHFSGMSSSFIENIPIFLLFETH